MDIIYQRILALLFSGFPGTGAGAHNLIDVEEGGAGGDGQTSQSKTQILLEEEYNIEQLQEREKAIRQLEVKNVNFAVTGKIS